MRPLGLRAVFSRRSSRGCESLGGPARIAPQNSGHVFFGFRGLCQLLDHGTSQALCAAASVLGEQPMP